MLKLDQKIIGLDNFATGISITLMKLKDWCLTLSGVNSDFVEGDIRDYETCIEAVKGVDYVLHQAALGSVPRSIADPIASNAANISGF